MSAAPTAQHPRLREVTAFLEAQRDGVRAAAHGIPDDAWTIRATAEGWSPAEIMDHLRIVEHGIVRLMQKFVPELQASDARETATSSILDQAFIARTLDRSVRIDAPPRVMPTRAPDRDTALTAMDAERAALLQAIAAADGLALGDVSWPHPVLGTLDLYQWLVFVGAHEGRHAAQLRVLAVEFAPRA